jgi:hypothetical protein
LTNHHRIGHLQVDQLLESLRRAVTVLADGGEDFRLLQ